MKKIFYIPIFLLFASWMGLLVACKDDSLMKTPYRKFPKAEYTREAPDEWAGLEDSHVPVVSIHRDREPDIDVLVNFTDRSPSHYIEVIGIMDEKLNVIVSKQFTTNDKTYQASFFSAELKGKKNLKAYTRCSLHSLWTAPLELP